MAITFPKTPSPSPKPVGNVRSQTRQTTEAGDQVPDDKWQITQDSGPLSPTPTPDDILKTQYGELAENWRHFNSIVWGIPTVAVAIMTGVIVAAYQPGLEGWPRFVALGVGAIFLFALTIEVVKKRLHMSVISDILNELQRKGLKLDDEFVFPVGLSNDVEGYWTKSNNQRKEKPDKDWLFKLLECKKARKYLAYVIFFATIAVAGLAVSDLFSIVFKQLHIILPYNITLP